MITLQSSAMVASNIPQSIVYSGPTGLAANGDLLVLVASSYRQITSVSAGWDEVASIGSVGQWLKVLTRLYNDSQNNSCALSYSAVDEGPVTAIGTCWRATNGFQLTPVKSHTENTTNGSVATSYALSSALSNVTSGTLAILIGGDADSYRNSLTCGASGTNWNAINAWSTLDYGHGVIATYLSTGTTSVPNVTFSVSKSTTKFAAGLVLQENAAGPVSYGLFGAQ